MSDFDQFDTNTQEPDKDKSGEDTAQGGRKSGGSEEPSKSGSGNPTDSLTKTAGDTVGKTTDQVGNAAQGVQKTITGLTKADTEDMAGSLKIHVKLALEVDIRIIARLKGDIAIGIL